jgi:hypothetical protein
MTNFPANDEDFEDKTIEKVEPQKDGTWAITCDGWGIYCGDTFKTEPKVGGTARFYPKDNIGRRVRGLIIDGNVAWYRNEADDAEWNEIQMYGANAADWLTRWDADRGCWSIEMGGLGPGYEQAIQITMAEILRHLLAEKYDHAAWADTDVWKRDRELIDKASFANPVISGLGLSGAQWGAALGLATKFYMQGPRAIMNDKAVKDRHIQVSRSFPRAA